VAKVALARKLVLRLYWMLRRNTPYPEVVRMQGSMQGSSSHSVATNVAERLSERPASRPKIQAQRHTSRDRGKSRKP